MTSNEYSTIYGVIRHHKFELQVSSIEEIKQQQLAELRRTNNAEFEIEKRDYRVSMFFPGLVR